MSSPVGRAAAVTVVLLVVAALPTAGRQPPVASSGRPVDVASLGPGVGEAVPSFTLNDQHGTPRTLSSLIGPKGAILVFFRSADW